MRQRGNQVVEFSGQGEPPSLAFDYELVMDGRDLARPVNYMLLRLEPPERFAVDPTKRPYVIVEPRSGARPGIAASSVASEVGVAMQGGHPVYLVAFRADPEPGQTMEDIGHAQARFLQKVRTLHAEGQDPARRGRGQADRGRQQPGRLGGDDAGCSRARSGRDGRNRRRAAVLLGRSRGRPLAALSGRPARRQLAGLAARGSG
jgi:hypothetical protein